MMKKWLIRLLWALFALGMIVLLVMTQAAQKKVVVAKPEIIIHVDGENAFLTEDELYSRLKRKGFFSPGQPHEKLNVSAIEKYIREMSEVKDVKVFTRLGENWTIDIIVRKPIARIFNKYGESFYLDEDGFVMRTSDLHTARVVVVTGYIPDKLNSISVPEIINNDSLKSIRKLDDVYRISNYVCKDPFLRSLVGQIHLKKNDDFVLIPLVGGQKIIFGSAHTDEEVKEKFDKLMIFYNEAIPFEGWNKYDEISLKYNRQIVGKKVDGYEESEEKKKEVKTE
jgi:cell division protein FtsQ